MSTDVKEPRLEYANALAGVERNRAAISGGRAVKKGGVKFLAPLASMCCNTVYDNAGGSTVSYSHSLTAEGQASYNKYLDNAYFEDVTGRTVQGLLGLIYSKPAKAEFPTEIEYLIENADGKGTPLRELSKAGCEEAHASDWSGYLTARPSTPEGASEKDVETNNLRPKLLHYKFESIINWNYEVVNNVEKLSLLILKEAVTKQDGFKVEVEAQYRVLQIIKGVYHQAVYNEDCELIAPSKPVIVNGNNSDTIPFFWVKAPCTGSAPIVGLVDANFQQYKLYADYGGKLHHSSFVIYTETGAEAGANIVMGNGVKWTNRNPEAKFGVLQPDGNSDGHRLALQDISETMASQGAEQLRPRASGAESAEAKSLDKVAQNSTTSDIATTVSEAITKASDFASKWMGGNGGVIYSLNTDYNPTGINPQLLATVFAIYQSGSMPTEDFFTFLQRGELVNSAKTIEQYIAETALAGTGME
tara:strand:+ start:14502 stop:15923 length:1422 start_codon:yes stop_codon:yes gene_type:complete